MMRVTVGLILGAVLVILPVVAVVAVDVGGLIVIVGWAAGLLSGLFFGYSGGLVRGRRVGKIEGCAAGLAYAEARWALESGRLPPAVAVEDVLTN